MGLTKEQAIILGNSKFYEELSDREIIIFQLLEGRLCMPLHVLHEALQRVLDRPVFTHKMQPYLLLCEMFNLKSKTTMKEILELTPKDKQIVVVTEGESE